MLLVDALAQLFEGRTVIDVQLHGGEAGRRQCHHVLGLARTGPDLETGRFEGIGQGAADAAGTTGD
ncbi:hypothetical protein D3C80_1597640 [compost metagenome]